ncbi:MAG: hypothetical protein AB9883_07980 [Acidaminococcaceae bacterium]
MRVFFLFNNIFINRKHIHYIIKLSRLILGDLLGGNNLAVNASDFSLDVLHAFFIKVIHSAIFSDIIQIV